jgi:hypothetical protein
LEPGSGAVARFQLARTLWLQAERERALALARQARDTLTAERRAEVAEVDRWLRARSAR